MKSISKRLTQILLIACSFVPFYPYSSFADLTEGEINRLLYCYKTLLKSKEGKKKYDFALHRFDQKSTYKLFIDRERLKNPKPNETNVPPHLIFDVKEPGYHKGMTAAFDLISERIGSENSLDLLIAIHDTALKGVRGLTQGLAFGARYALIKEGLQIDPRALEEMTASRVLFRYEEMREAISKDLNPNACQLLDEYLFPSEERKAKYLSKLEGKTVVNDGQKAESQIAPFLDHYKENIKNLKSLHGKLMAISELIRALEVYHVFADGNQRTYAFAFLTKLLIENDIPPAILDDPYMFDGYFTVETMAQQIRKGITNFLNEAADSQKDFLDHECKQINAQESDYLAYIDSNSSEYPPYFEKAGKIKAADEVRAEFRKKALAAIRSNSITDLYEKDEYIKRALLYTDLEVLNEMHSKGLVDVNKYAPFALSLWNLEALKFFLPHIRDEKTFQNLLKTASTPSIDPKFKKEIEKFIKKDE